MGESGETVNSLRATLYSCMTLSIFTSFLGFIPSTIGIDFAFFFAIFQFLYILRRFRSYFTSRASLSVLMLIVLMCEIIFGIAIALASSIKQTGRIPAEIIYTANLYITSSDAQITVPTWFIVGIVHTTLQIVFMSLYVVVTVSAVDDHQNAESRILSPTNLVPPELPDVGDQSGAKLASDDSGNSSLLFVKRYLNIQQSSSYFVGVHALITALLIAVSCFAQEYYPHPLGWFQSCLAAVLFFSAYYLKSSSDRLECNIYVGPFTIYTSYMAFGASIFGNVALLIVNNNSLSQYDPNALTRRALLTALTLAITVFFAGLQLVFFIIMAWKYSMNVKYWETNIRNEKRRSLPSVNNKDVGEVEKGQKVSLWPKTYSEFRNYKAAKREEQKRR